MNIFHVKGKELEEIKYNEADTVEFLSGDVYLVQHMTQIEKKVYIWLGSQSCVDEKAVGAWAARQLDIKDPEIDIDTVEEGKEPDEFKSLIKFTVISGDTPGFLKHIDVDKEKTYAMYHIRDMDLTDGSSWDDLDISNVSINRDSLKTGDVFVLDTFDALWVWIGASSQVGEKAAGNRLARKLDIERARNPLIYVVHEGKEPPGFFNLMDEIGNLKESIRKDAKEVSRGIVEVSAVAKRETAVHLEKRASPAIFTLYFDDDVFHEKTPQKYLATLILNDSKRTATLQFEPDAGLVSQRKISRQARGICKTGFLLNSGYRVGIKFDLSEIAGEKKIDDRLLQQGHKYI